MGATVVCCICSLIIIIIEYKLSLKLNCINFIGVCVWRGGGGVEVLHIIQRCM